MHYRAANIYPTFKNLFGSGLSRLGLIPFIEPLYTNGKALTNTFEIISEMSRPIRTVVHLHFILVENCERLSPSVFTFGAVYAIVGLLVLSGSFAPVIKKQFYVNIGKKSRFYIVDN